ncbi:PREDICTED: translocase of chloroplast 33, chloroplastic-like [Amphimedon queenslandica]|uniref:AIG1-type G domain-containing protein n=1 Tax=Amphimedon queenslandica TaxID=400682 RepID=A0A1X7SQM2_AMPQE|nr:PREDICTED: translocase of chloroplast 33, chloroplastic-like [Amphimedon queenslandica]|eukprot:XP_011409015.1 PREDICTED: translocase of chloroplast 33, chloroplastic-like [Amphimedon queenslandica]
MDDKWNVTLDIQDSIEIQTVSSPNENLPSEEPQFGVLQEKEKFGRNDVHILFTGLSGAGKSTLVNAMLGEVLAQTGYGPDSIEASKSYYEGVFEEVKLQVCDTNGYSESNHKIPKSRRFNLILICIKITNHVGDSEINLLHALGKAFDKEAWSRTVIVLTFANLLIYDSKIEFLRTKEAKCQAINDTKDEYIESIRKHLKDFMDKETLCNIPFCLAGKSDPFDPTNRDARTLPTTEDWLVDLWETCAERVSPENKTWFSRLYDFIKKILLKILRKEEQQNEEKQVKEQDEQVEEQQHNEERQQKKVEEVELKEKQVKVEVQQNDQEEKF